MTQSSEVSEEEIREKAYELWEKAGSPDGKHEEFWHQAREFFSGKGESTSEREVDKGLEDSFPASDPVNYT